MATYAGDRAYIHDAGSTAFATPAATKALALLRDADIERGLVVELGPAYDRVRLRRGYHGGRFAPGRTVFVGRRPHRG